MKRKMPLKWWLMGSMLGIWFVIIIVFVIVLSDAISSFDARLAETIDQQVLASARSVSHELGQPIEEQNAQAIKEHVGEFKTMDTDLHSITVLSTANKVIYGTGDRQAYKKWLTAFKPSKTASYKVFGDVSVAIAPVLSADKRPIARVVYAKSLTNYQKDKSGITFGIFIVAIFGLAVVLVAAYFIGTKTAHPIVSLMDAAKRISEGDLENISLEDTGSFETSELGASIKRMGDALQSQVHAIKRLTEEISSVSRETEGTMTNLASSATQQAAAVNETAATVEEMEKAGQSSAGNANLIVSAAEKTREASTRGRQTVEKTYEIIMQIKEQSEAILDKSKNLLNSVEEVGNIIQSVNSIAEQSKILAVNASIEAAKAGEYGSGFAVVAQEVKDLAQQSKDATLRITGTLTGIREAIEAMVSTAQSGKERSLEGVNTIANAGAVMNDLSEAIRENSDFANVIATNIKQQTVGLTQIAAAVEEINTTALENQTISRNIVDGSRQMNDSLELLSNMVGQWNTGENSDIESSEERHSLTSVN